MPVTVHAVGLERAGLPEQGYDTIVTTLVLCTVDDLDAAVARLRNLLAPGGRLLFLEHVVGTGARRRLQQVASPVWRRVAAGCHCDRDTLGALRGGGFSITDLERFSLPMPNPLVRPAAQGVAQRGGPDVRCARTRRRRGVAGRLQLRRRPARDERSA